MPLFISVRVPVPVPINLRYNPFGPGWDPSVCSESADFSVGIISWMTLQNVLGFLYLPPGVNLVQKLPLLAKKPRKIQIGWNTDLAPQVYVGPPQCKRSWLLKWSFTLLLASSKFYWACWTRLFCCIFHTYRIRVADPVRIRILQIRILKPDPGSGSCFKKNHIFPVPHIFCMVYDKKKFKNVTWSVHI